MALSRKQVRNLDQRAIEEFKIPGLILMENAGLNITAAVLAYIKSQSLTPKPLIVCGRGNNGGDGLVLARHLFLAGIVSTVAYIDALEEGPGTHDASVNLDIVKSLGLPLVFVKSPEELTALFPSSSALLCDAFLGTGIQSELRPFARSIVSAMNEWPEDIIAIDIPSGLDCDKGVPLGESVRASRTITMAAMKTGFLTNEAKAFTGQVEVVPIGAPPSLLPEGSPRIPQSWQTL
ncbi:MAG: NAD(P)H-hydrate epimerase [Planctomycetota bacterium]|nr:NAD(P)H-hydrate epimerase [Planctomycetota bacterium]